jgi:L-ectoine synthase
MIVRKLDEIVGTKRDVSGPGWRSRRILTAQDGLGYSLNDTLISPGQDLTLEYKHHFEACYCISGQGEISAQADNIVHKLRPFTIYALDKNDRHTVRAIGGEMRLICVFNPALTGDEVHREDGSFPVPD